MTTIANVSKLAGAVVAGAMLLGWGTAEACSLAAWTSTTGSPAAGGPNDATPILRYSGVCGLRPNPAGNSFVVESTNHANEGATTPFRARFFTYTGMSGNPVVFRATSDEGGATPVISIAYNDASDNFAFTVNGTTLSTANGSAPANNWVQVEFVYQTGQPFTASTSRMLTTTTLGAGLTGGAGVERVELGVISGGGGTGAIFLDEYEASRAASGTPPPFTPRIRGDATGDGVCNSNDITSAANDILFSLAGLGAMAAGQPDCTANGTVNSDDISCIATRIIDDLLGTQACN